MPSLTVDQVLSGVDLGLDFGMADLLVLDIGGRRVLYALSRIEGMLAEIDIAADGSLTFDDSLPLSGTFAVGVDPILGVLQPSDGSTSLSLAGMTMPDGQTATLAPDGSLGLQTSLTVAGTLIAPVSGVTASVPVFVTGRQDGGLDLYGDTGAGYTFVGGLADSSDTYLADVAASTWFSHDGGEYFASVSATEDGVNLVGVTPTGLVQHDALGAAEGLPINTPVEIGTLQRLGEQLLVTGSFNTSSISVVRIGPEGDMQVADHVLDAPGTYFQGLSALDTLTYGDFAFAAAGGSDGGASLFTVLPGGRLVHLDSIADDATTTLYRVSSIELVSTGARLDMLISSAWESRITRVGYDLSALGAVLVADSSGGLLVGTSQSDQIVGSGMNDTLSGNAGDDILADGAGQDVMTGGAGSDLFVLHPDGQTDIVTDYERGVDRLDLSGWDFLYDVSQLSIVPTVDGAVLSHGAETLVITAADGTALTATDLSNATILHVDRPPPLPISQNLQGGPGADMLNGAWGNDTINGSGGDDVLSGLGGDDSITGGSGDDILDGGIGTDTLAGEAGADTLVGGAGDDRLLGGMGDDVIYGDEHDWSGG